MDEMTYKAINRARLSLNQGEKKLVVADGNKILHHSKESGVRPLLDLIENNRAMLKDAVVGDRIVGRAAALLCVYAEVKAVFALIISDEAIELLEKNGILAAWQETVPYIVEKDLSSRCRLDIYLKDVEDPGEAVEMAKEYSQSAD